MTDPKAGLVPYRDAFSLFDKGTFLYFVYLELGTVMRSLGRNPTDAEIKGILDKIDKDHNGTIDFSEFVDLMGLNPESLTPGLPPGTGPWSSENGGRPKEDPETDELRQAFDVFDKDGSGSISIGELKSVMESLGEKLTQEELQLMIDEADLDGDHEISFNESVTNSDFLIFESSQMVGGMAK
ncbi:hypothetical protein CPB84DRAFT_1777928 [Gymnopilus junonius]|uniref:EF-hand domain-containing protein n=1 Tax=Gymnopilus junonius TaxID=109634 RepID=A0A9P5NR52_GYMJU|nr:hypothetical protein CPB84DRAFT_1777928 [Gymnopilus junonius]